MTSAEEIGMTWYNSCSEADRKKWHAAANSAVPADAYRAFCVQSAQPAVEPGAQILSPQQKDKLRSRLSIILMQINCIEHKYGTGGARYETVQEQLEAIVKDHELKPLPSFEMSLPITWVKNGVVVEPRDERSPYFSAPTTKAEPAVEPVADLIDWDVLPEDASERNRFDRNLTLLHGGDARVAVTTALRLWAAAHSGRDFGLMCAIFANEVAKMRVAAPPADALGGEGRTELGSKGGAA